MAPCNSGPVMSLEDGGPFKNEIWSIRFPLDMSLANTTNPSTRSGTHGQSGSAHSCIVLDLEPNDGASAFNGKVLMMRSFWDRRPNKGPKLTFYGHPPSPPDQFSDVWHFVMRHGDIQRREKECAAGEMFPLTKRLRSFVEGSLGEIVYGINVLYQLPRNPSDPDQFSDLWPLRDLMILIARYSLHKLTEKLLAGAISRNSAAQTCSRSEKLAASL